MKVKVAAACMISMLVLILLLPVSAYFYVNYQLMTLKEETITHLFLQGYKQQDILRVKTKIKKLSVYTAEVTFKDEPDVTYDYKFNTNKIIQIGVSNHPISENYVYKHAE